MPADRPEPELPLAEADLVAATVATGGPSDDFGALPRVARENYAIDGEFARGGMGRILSARDRRLGRAVALKELQQGAAPEAARFVREALITARLQHPAIVPIYEAGRWPDGSPFYAMKLVSGRSLDALIRSASGLSERLALVPHLLAVAEAVAYAHGQRVIHRDLKPANVLVGPFGETVLLDWGLAKDLRQPSDTEGPEPAAPPGAAGEETVAGSVLGTPAFMAPEQARGEAVDERADVYALGAMLYYLLAGAPPHAGTTVQEVVAAAATKSPEPIERREPGAPFDLVAIVTKAMAPLPVDRYPTAEALANDLRRFQTGQLVSAHRYSTGELLRRFVRQHRPALTVAAVALLAVGAAIAAGFAAVDRQARIAEAERDRARLEAEKATQVSAFLREMLGSADPRTEGRDVRVAAVLDRAAARLATELQDQPEVRAALHLTLGQTYQGLGLLVPAERELRQALAERLALPGLADGDVARAQEALASLLLENGDFASAEALYREALATFARAGESETEHALTARANRAAALENLGRMDEAEAEHRELIARRRRADPPDSLALAVSLNNLGIVLGQRGDWAGAEPLHRESLELIGRARGEASPETAAALTALANVIESRGELERAEALYRDALALRRAALGDEHPDTARALYALAGVLRARGQPAAAEALAAEALALRGRTLPETHPMVAALLQVLGLSLLDQQRPGEALPLLRESLALRRATLPAEHWLLASSESGLAAALAALGRFAEAEALLVPAHERLAAALGPSHERTLETRARLAALYEAWGRPQQADRLRAAAPDARRE